MTRRLLAVLVVTVSSVGRPEGLPYASPNGAQARDGASTPTTRNSASASTIIAGRVVTNAPQPTPVRLAFVTIAGSLLERSRTTVTGDDGTFQFGDLPEGRFTLTARKVTFIDSAYGAIGAGEPGTPIVVGAGQQVTGLQLPLIAGAVISGTLRDGNGLGVPDATVMAVRTVKADAELLFRTNAPITTTTDDQGAYRLFGLVPDNYVVVATPPGVGNTRPMQSRTDSQVDEVLRRLERRGQPGVPAPAPADAMADLGKPRGYAPIYFPGTAVAAEADIIRLASGDERSGLDIVLTPVPTVTVTGTISAPGMVMPPVQLFMQPLGPRLPGPPSMNGVTPALYDSNIGPSGSFKYTNVPPGQYRLGVRTTAPVRVTPGMATAGQTRPPLEGESLFWGAAEFTVTTEDVIGLSIAMQPSLTISGRLQFDGATPRPTDLTTLRIGIGTGGGSSAINGTIFGSIPVPPAIVRADGTFEFRNVVPGTYRLNITPMPQGWMLRSAIVDGRDVVDLPLEVRRSDMAGLMIRFSDRLAELSGTLQTAPTDPVSRYVVVLLPADRSLWRPGSRWIRLARPSSDGAFSIDNLPGGEYLIALLTNATTVDLEHTDFLDQAAQSAVRVRIGEGDRVRQDLRVGQ